MKLLSIKSKIKSISYSLKENIKGGTNYTKFVVITRSRTGSNLLISLLNSHNDIKVFGEKFSRLEGKTTQMIYRDVFPKKSTRSVGFKLFYYHPLDSEDNSIWDILKNDRDIKIIHLLRENLLRIHISRMIAGKTDEWISKNDNKRSVDSKRVEIDVDSLLLDIETTVNYIKKTREDFNKHDMIEVTYENLVKNNKVVLETILNFIEVPTLELNTPLKKQNPEQLEQLISNYQEVKEKLDNTKYSYLLNE